MTSAWHSLSIDQQAALIEHVIPADLQRIYGIRIEEINAARDSAEQAKAQTKVKESNSAYDQFLLTEYNNIASAHFNADTNITKFFQFYLIIIGFPITLVGAVLQFVSSGDETAIATIFASNLGWFFFLGSLSIAIVGVCMLAYIINLRLDSLLYARVVNGVRRHFLDRGNIDIATELATRVLPRSTSAPPYRQWSYFGFVVGAFSVLNTFYVGSAGIVVGYLCGWTQTFWFIYFLSFACLLWFFLNLKIYEFLTHFRENYQLFRYRIGVDVDGVLNKHREQFCKILKEETGKIIQPEDITKIPVHECVGLTDQNGDSVTREDEKLVFNKLEYWQDMPACEDAARTLREFKESLHYDVHIFTYRPWPNPTEYTHAVEQNLFWAPEIKSDKLSEFQNAWSNLVPFSTWAFKAHEKSLGKWIDSFLEWRRYRAKLKVTKNWLNENGIRRNTLRVERGDVYVADPHSKMMNRFTISKSKEIRIFIEDDAKKARKLSNICEFVYLIAHPYNESDVGTLPRNVIRVSNLTEARRHIRDNL